MADKATERSKYKTEVLKLQVVFTLAIGGGSLSVVIGGFTVLRLSLATLGILVTLVVLLTAWRQHRRIEQLIEQLGEDP